MNQLIPTFRSIEKLTNNRFVSIVFQKSTAHAYILAVKIAKQADEYNEVTEGKKLLHFAFFNRSSENAALAVSLIEAAGHLQGIQVWVLGEIILYPFNVSQVLKCYYTSTLCDDSKAHCIVYHEDKPESSGPITITLNGYPRASNSNVTAKYLIPCQRIRNQYAHSGLRPEHPASLEDQIQSMAVAKGCHWCPNFSKKNFRNL